MSTTPLDPQRFDSRAPFDYLTTGAAEPATELAVIPGLPLGRVGFYENEEQARVAVKLLVNSGFDAEHVFVLCPNDKWKDESLATRVYVGPPENDASIYFMTATGASMGAAGGALLATVAAWPVAVVAAGIAGIAGGAIGAMLGAGSFSDDETQHLVDLYHRRIEQGEVVVVVKPTEGQDPAQMERAAELLAAAADAE